MTVGYHHVVRTISTCDLTAIEGGIRDAWTGARSTPFLAEAPLAPRLRIDAEKAIRSRRLPDLFFHYPTLATWGVLFPLAANYDRDRDVYRHIATFSGQSFEDSATRAQLKARFRIAARRLGLPIVESNDPTDLFFAPLGPARAHHETLAGALVAAALALGPPPIEDTAAARAWQRRTVAVRCQNIPRLRATIAFDQSAWIARRFEAWRRGIPAMTESEAHLFAAYDAATEALGRRRGDIVGPPRLYWSGYSLAFEPEAARLPQSLALATAPTPLAGGRRATFPPPWGETVTWTCNGVARQIPAGPGPDEVLLFDEAGGALLARIGPQETRIELPAERHVVLARRPFAATSFGPATPGRDPECFLAWTEAGDRLSFEGRAELALLRPAEAALWIEAPVLGRNLSRPLHACDGRLHLKLDPGVGGPVRIIRACIGDAVRYRDLETGAEGVGTLDFAALDLDRPGEPVHVVFEALAPGAAGDPEARSELAVSAWIWPGVDAATGAGDLLPAPATLAPGRCAGLRLLDGWLHIDHRADVPAPILALQNGETVREFRLAVRGERLWHVRVGAGDQVRVPRGARLVFGHAQRHDALLLRSDDREADLLVLGTAIRRPFFARSRFTIGAEMLERGFAAAPEGPDDRIALRRKDGRLEVLGRIARIDDPFAVDVWAEDETGARSEIGGEIGNGIRVGPNGAAEPSGAIRLALNPRGAFDALVVRIEPVSGPASGAAREGGVAFSRHPVSAPLPAGVTATLEDGRLDIRITLPHPAAPALARFFLRTPEGDLLPMADAYGASFALGIPGGRPPADVAGLVRLAGFLAEPAPAALGGQVEAALGPAYAAGFAAVGSAHMVGAVKPVLAIGDADERTPRHDLIGVAPWLFEAKPFAFGHLPRSSGLSVLSAMACVPAPASLPDPRGDRPLADWLDRLAATPDLPGLGADELAHGFVALRFRLRETDLRSLVCGPEAPAAGILAAAWIEEIDRLRIYDHAGGGDERAARFAALLDRFARASALGEAATFLDRLVFRTGLPVRECGRVLTLILRAGVEIFSYFRVLWHHAAAKTEALP